MIVVKEKSRIIRGFFHSDFKDFSNEEKKDIYDMKHTYGYKLFCNCSENMPELTIAKLENTIYIRNNPGNGEKHNLTCRFHSQYQGTNEYEKGWKINEDGTIEANIDISLLGRKRKKGESKDGENFSRRLLSYPAGGSSSINKVSLLGLMCKLNLMSWDDYLRNKGTMPKNIGSFFKQVYGTSKKVSIKGKENMQTYKYSYSKLKALKDDEFLFVYLPLIKYYPNNSEKYYRIDMACPGEKEGFTTRIGCSKEILDKALISAKERVGIEVNGEFSTIVGGFVKKNFKGYAYFVSLEFLPIIKQGLWAESSYERIIYSKLVDENIPFIKGYEPLEYYNNFVPDIIFKDEKYRRKPYLGEIFGIRDIEEYDERKKEKKELAEKSKDKFDFWYWDVTESNEPPRFIIR